MAELTAFGYQPGNSVFHNLDARFKLLFLISISLASLKSGPLAMFISSLVIFGVLCFLDIKIIRALIELRFFCAMLVLILLARSVSTPGEVILQFKSILISRQGIIDGLMICWRLLFIVFSGLSFISSTRASQIRDGLENLLSPIPLIPQKQIAIMLGLLIRFLPIIFHQARETGDAQRARCVENRKNPVYRLTCLIIPLFRRTFSDADALVIAMEARCFNDKRQTKKMSATGNDWWALLAVLGLNILLISV